MGRNNCNKDWRSEKSQKTRVIKGSGYKRKRMWECRNLFLNRLCPFTDHLFIHGAGRRLDQRSKRLFTVVALSGFSPFVAYGPAWRNSGFQVQDSTICQYWLGCWIPIVSGILDFLSCILHSKTQDSGFRMQNLPGFRTPLHGAKETTAPRVLGIWLYRKLTELVNLKWSKWDIVCSRRDKTSSNNYSLP